MLTKKSLAAISLLLCAGVARSQEAARTQVAAPAAFVTLDNEHVFTVRAGYGAWTPQVRADSMTQHVKRWADDSLTSATPVIHDNETTTDLLVDGVPVITVSEIDAAAAGVPRQELAREWATALEDAVSQYRLRYAPTRLIARIVLGMLTLVSMGLLLFFARKWALRTETEVIARLTTHARQRRSKLTGIVAEGAIGGWVNTLFTWIRWGIYALVILAGVQFLLLLSPRTRADAMQIVSSVGGSLTQLGWRIWQQIPSIILICVIAAIAYQLVQLVHAIFKRVGRGQIVLEGFRPRWAGVTDRLVSYFIAVLALLIMYPYIPGSNSAAFQGIGIFVGALISLGSTGLVGNALSGIILTYTDGYQVGDFVEFGDIKGRVQKMALMTTQISKANHEVVTLPNAIVMAHATINHSAHRDKGHVVSLTIGIGYDTAWRLVEMLLEKAAQMTPGVNHKAGVTVLTLSLNQFDITYELHVYISEGESIPVVRSVLARNILDRFNESGVQIMTPAFESNPHYSVMVPKDKWYPPPMRNGSAESVEQTKAL